MKYCQDLNIISIQTITKSELITYFTNKLTYVYKNYSQRFSINTNYEL